MLSYCSPPFSSVKRQTVKHTRKEKFNIVFVVARSFTDHDQNQHYLLLTNLLQIRLCVHVCWMCNIMHIFKFTVCIIFLTCFIIHSKYVLNSDWVKAHA